MPGILILIIYFSIVLSMAPDGGYQVEEPIIFE